MKCGMLLLAFLFLAACKNQGEDKKPRFPLDLYITRINKTSGVRMYVNKIEIKDQVIINKFVEGDAIFGVNAGGVVSDEKISFLNTDTASVETLYNKKVVTHSDKQFIFRSIEQGRISSEHARLIYNMNKYRSELGPPWYDGLFRVDNLMVGYGDYSEIELSVYNYKIVKAHMFENYYGMGPYLYRSVASGKVFNEFDELYINSLTLTDTLAIEEYTYTFRSR
ncbi:hypothetical protein [Dyadobacter sp. NIV53]|uniref:hypothetical protein n=1 Tax=Dyadobacter sp. NIV53 TaxID=2861765 RepID=UPI001C85292E|nr:hypothetical protein [Dyadobacter sp. NIV53]